MLPQLGSKRFAIFGLQGSGKTVLAKHILLSEPWHLVYDPKHEYDPAQGFNRYRAAHDQYGPQAIQEVNAVVNRFVIGPGKVKLFLMDEANNFCPNAHPLPNAIRALNDYQRHYGLAWGVIARRMVQLNTDLVELAHFLFIFRLVGKNDQRYLDDLVPGLAETVFRLAPFSFAIVDQDRNVSVHPPLPFL